MIVTQDTTFLKNIYVIEENGTHLVSKGRSRSFNIKVAMTLYFLVVSSVLGKNGFQKVVSLVTILWLQMLGVVSSVTMTYDSLISNFSSKLNISTS